MLIAGGLSFVVGAFYDAQAAGDKPSLSVLSVYATGGGIFFIVQAGLLAWKARRVRFSRSEPGARAVRARPRTGRARTFCVLGRPDRASRGVAVFSHPTVPIGRAPERSSRSLRAARRPMPARRRKALLCRPPL